MRKKTWIISIGLVLLLVLTSFPTLNSQSIRINAKGPLTNTLAPEKKTGNPDMVEMRIYQSREDGSFEETVKELTVDENDELMNKLTQTAGSNLTVKEKFEGQLEILKEYELVPSNITLEDIMDVEKLDGYGQQTKNVTGENFYAFFAPIFFAGVGLGFGLGARLRLIYLFSELNRLRLVNWFSQFILAMAGVGFVLCYVILEDT